MNVCTVGYVYKPVIFPNILAVDETKHMLLFIFHALYMCVTVRDYMQTKGKWILCKNYLKISKYHRYACYIFFEK